MDEVVDLPLVPVTQTTRSRSASCSHSPSPPTRMTPGLAEAGRLRPVGADAGGLDDDLAGRPGRPGRRRRWRGRPALAGGLSSTRTGSTPSARSLRRDALPSRPSPQTPTRAPRRSDQPSLGRTSRAMSAQDHSAARAAGTKLAPTGRRMASISAWVGASGRPLISAASCCRSGAAGPVRPPGGEHDRRPALVDLADALERLGARAEQRLELRRQLRVVERLAAAAVGREHGPQLLGRHERGEDQVDEAALVAGAAPVVEPALPVDDEGLIAAAERRVVLGQGGELVAHPELGPVAEGGEVARAFRPGRRRGRRGRPPRTRRSWSTGG